MKKTKMLKKNYEFKKVLIKGKYYKGKVIDIVILKNNLSINLLGLAVSKKTGNSVTRNRIKRLIRENYRIIEDEINIGYSLVVLCKKNTNVQNINYKKIKEDIYEICKKACITEGSI